MDIIPYVGIDTYFLKNNKNSIKNLLEKNSISYREEVWDASDCTIPVNWEIIQAENGLNFFFAKECLFKILIKTPYNGSLPNGIHVGMRLEKVKEIDSDIEYDEWAEVWLSPHGYWIEDELDNHTVDNISIFIHELENDEIFEKYEWVTN